MFKAIDRRTEEEIIILDPQWAAQVAHLRTLAAQDDLVCQGCQQPVRVRTLVVRRWHFAHRQLLDCTYGHDSPILLQSRAMLYDWLVSKFGKGVTLEKKLPDHPLPRPVDCWVDRPAGAYAYWILESGLKFAAREELAQAFRQPGVTVHWVFLSSGLRADESDMARVHLTTTERRLARTSPYDLVLGGSYIGESLHITSILRRGR